MALIVSSRVMPGVVWRMKSNREVYKKGKLTVGINLCKNLL